MASGLNKRKMIQHAVFKELVKVRVYHIMPSFSIDSVGKNTLALQIGILFQNAFSCFLKDYSSVLKY